MPTKEQVQEYAVQTWEVTKANVNTLKEAGLFKGEHAIAFAKELALPFDKENFSIPQLQATLLAQVELTRGFTIMNAAAFFLEVLGDLTALLLGRALPLFIFEIVYSARNGLSVLRPAHVQQILVIETAIRAWMHDAGNSIAASCTRVVRSVKALCRSSKVVLSHPSELHAPRCCVRSMLNHGRYAQLVPLPSTG